MRKLFKIIAAFIFAVISINFVACNKDKIVVAEDVSFDEAIIGEVEFQNSDDLTIEQNDNEWEVNGRIDVMSDAQKAAFGSQDVTHVVVLKLIFDKERTIDYLKIKGDLTKVYSTDKNDSGYVGSISSVLDNDDGEDAFTYLILSANTKYYELTIKYTDEKVSNLKIKINALLVEAKNK